MVEELYDRGGQVFLFKSRTKLEDFSWSGDDAAINKWIPPGRDQLEPFAQGLKEQFGVSDSDDMRLIFANWPADPVEEWAEDYNTEFRLDFEPLYDAHTMEAFLYICCWGVYNMDWKEYLDGFQQAQTMAKLKEGL